MAEASAEFIRDLTDGLLSTVDALAPELAADTAKLREAAERATEAFASGADVDAVLNDFSAAAAAVQRQKRKQQRAAAATAPTQPAVAAADEWGAEEEEAPVRNARKSTRPAAPAAAAAPAAETPSRPRHQNEAAMTPPDPQWPVPPATPPVAMTMEAAEFSPDRMKPTPRPAAAHSPMRPYSVGLSGGAPDVITLFCVYNGALAQRAKAIRSSRSSPDLPSIMATLKRKFKRELCLGYVEIDSGEFTEVTSSAQLAEIIARDHAAADALTLHCWRIPGDWDDVESRPGSAMGAQTPMRTPGRHGGRSVATRSNASTKQTKAKKYDIHRVMGGDEAELRELFDALDADHGGYLDREEFKAFYMGNFDAMGIDDQEAKFDKLLTSLPEMEDGKLEFDEFAVVMLKLCQM